MVGEVAAQSLGRQAANFHRKREALRWASDGSIGTPSWYPTSEDAGAAARRHSFDIRPGLLSGFPRLDRREAVAVVAAEVHGGQAALARQAIDVRPGHRPPFCEVVGVSRRMAEALPEVSVEDEGTMVIP